MKKEDILKVLKGAGIAAAAAVLTYLSQAITEFDFGIYGPTVMAVWSIIVNFLRKLITPSAVTMAIAFAIAMFAASPALAADPKPVAKCDTCENCKCAEGFCPKRCAVSIGVKAKGNLDAANAAVAKGERVVLCLGVPAVAGAYSCGSLPGKAPGVYECFRFKKGEYANGLYDHLWKDDDLVMVPRAAEIATNCVNGVCYSPATVQRGIAQPTYGTTLGNCPNGQCSKQGVRSR